MKKHFDLKVTQNKNLRFNEKTLRILEHWSWWPDRKKSREENTDDPEMPEAIEMLKDRGYPITDSFIDFYTEFGGMYFAFKVFNKSMNSEVDRVVCFIMAESFEIEYDEMVIHYYPQFIGCEKLTLVGHLDGHSSLVIR